MKFLTRLVRELNWSRRSWSGTSDEVFHDELYRNDLYDPFSWSYPGYTTIRRFADIVEPFLPQSGLVLDLGCGPGEITCELAARRGDLQFLGIDHSAAAIAKADTNMKRRDVRNIRFERRNVEAYLPPGDVDLVTLFDSFHHLVRPDEFVKRLSPRVKRWALVEPRGSWAGTWQKDIDFDWLAQDLDKIRGHVGGVLGSMGSRGSGASAGSGDSTGSESSTGSVSSTGSESSGGSEDSPGSRDLSGLQGKAAKAVEAVERRYTLDDFRRFFDGHALDCRGTVAGLESYPAGWNRPEQLRDRFGKLQYELYREIDEWLYERNLDLHAKHWLIVAERGGPTHARSRSATSRFARAAAASHPSHPSHPVGQFDVRYRNYAGPSEAAPGDRFFATIELTNEGWDNWSSEDGIFLSYHWLDSHGGVMDFDGARTSLPRRVAAGATCVVQMAVRTPNADGRYQLAIDLVREGVTWFSEAGHPWLAVPFKVQAPRKRLLPWGSRR